MKNNKSKKQTILKTAARLVANQGFDATTTLQIAREAGVTEPLIYYHFKGKDDLFTRIIDATFSEYFSRTDELEKNHETPFGQIQKLIELQYDIAEEIPDEVQLIANFTQLNIAKRSQSRWNSTGTCPARLQDPDGTCAGVIRKYQNRHRAYLTSCLTKGIETGEFERLPVDETASLLVAYINGIIRYKAMNMG